MTPNTNAMDSPKSPYPPLPRWHFSIWCGGTERSVSVEAATCALECTDRYVWRDEQGNWIAEVLATAVIAVPAAVPVVVVEKENFDEIN